MEIVVVLGLLVVVGVAGYFVGKVNKKEAVPVIIQPKIFGLSEFERFVGAIPESAKADPATLNVVVSAGTGLAVGLLGFEDRVVPETEEAMGKKAAIIRENGEKVAGLQEEIVGIQECVAMTQRESAGAQARIDKLVELKALKTS